MSDLLLIDFSRTFVDGRDYIAARTSKDAIKELEKNKGKLNSIWMDWKLGSSDDIQPVLRYLVLNARVGNKYPVNVICVHSLEEAGWQLIDTKLKQAGYRTFRATVRDTLG